MRNPLQFGGATRRVGILLILFFIGSLVASAQTKSAKVPAKTSAEHTADADAADQEQLGATRKELIDLLRMNPKMVAFVRRDPMLLGDQEYVARNNPKLADYLKAHPEVMRNPEFYLFADLPNQGGGIHDVYVDESPWTVKQDPQREDVLLGVTIFTVFLTIVAVLVWLLRVLLENRRWNRVFKVQTEVYNKLLDKFSTNEEMLSYIRSESGKRFLDTAVLPVTTGVQQTPNPVARVLAPLQLGIVLSLVGAGMMRVRMSIPDAVTPLSVFGTLALMAGIGLIISAAVAFGLAKHLGLLQQGSAQPDSGLPQHPEVP